MNVLAIVVACGKEEEISDGVETAFLNLGNRPVLVHSLQVLQQSPGVDGIAIAVGKSRVESTLQIVKRFGLSKVCGIVVGGSSRMATLRNVFAKLPDAAPLLLLQEASRPFISTTVVEEAIKAARRYGCAIAARHMQDAIKIAPKGLKVQKTLDRGTAWMALTPQVFKAEVLAKIIDPKNKGVKLVDDESEFVGKPAEVHLINAGEYSLKIRNSGDLSVATAILNAGLYR